MKTDTASIDAAIMRLPKGDCRIEFGNYADGSAWAYVWVNGKHEITAEADGDSYAEAVDAAVTMAMAQPVFQP